MFTGSVYYMDDKGHCAQRFTAEGPVKFLLYSEGRDMIVVVTEGLILSQLRVANNGTTSEVAKVRAGNKFSHSLFVPRTEKYIVTFVEFLFIFLTLHNSLDSHFVTIAEAAIVLMLFYMLVHGAKGESFFIMYVAITICYSHQKCFSLIR